jgi:metallo-beta-lactamase class B
VKLLPSFCLLVTALLLHVTCYAAKQPFSEDLIVRKIGTNVYQHISYLQTQSFGKVDCNGMIVVNKGEAIVFDTPATEKASEELIKWVADSLSCKVVAVVATHFHEDCVGGLEAFHKKGIPSYATNKTISFAKQARFPVPQKGFDGEKEFKVGGKKVLATFMGEGHTRDNIIGYFPAENIMFGGCLIKELNAGKGNLADANTDAWPATVSKIKESFPKVTLVIPGHGKTGDVALLDYTIKLFSK